MLLDIQSCTLKHVAKILDFNGVADVANILDTRVANRCMWLHAIAKPTNWCYLNSLTLFSPDILFLS